MILIGQEGIKQAIDIWKMSNRFPRFIIITGMRGSGKTLISNYIARKISNYIIQSPIGVDAVRESIENSYKCIYPTVYIFDDADRMSPQAKNALLKLTEEPPKEAYVIMTLLDIANTLSTLRSRAVHIPIEPYTLADLENFTSDQKVLQIAQTPGQVKQIEQELNVDEFYTFCETVLDNIGVVSGVNAFKIAQRLKLKEDGEGYDPFLFANTIQEVCRDRCLSSTTDMPIEMVQKYTLTVYHTSNLRNDLRLVGVNKMSSVDNWIMEMRKIWKQ